jgi:hypothetical protein
LAILHQRRIIENNETHKTQRAGLPSGDFGHGGVRKAADELGQDLGP